MIRGLLSQQGECNQGRIGEIQRTTRYMPARPAEASGGAGTRPMSEGLATDHIGRVVDGTREASLRCNHNQMDGESRRIKPYLDRKVTREHVTILLT